MGIQVNSKMMCPKQDTKHSPLCGNPQGFDVGSNVFGICNVHFVVPGPKTAISDKPCQQTETIHMSHINTVCQYLQGDVSLRPVLEVRQQ